jgi:hypothetical protein
MSNACLEECISFARSLKLNSRITLRRRSTQSVHSARITIRVLVLVLQILPIENRAILLV